MNKNIKNGISIFYRVQGGTFPNRSKERIKITDNGEINCGRNNYVYIGDLEHMKYFLIKRLNIKRPFNENFNGSLQTNNLRDTDVSVVKMYVPDWFLYLLNYCAVDDHEKIYRRGMPQLVDKSSPGNSYGIRGSWTDLLEACCYFAEIKPVKTSEDIKNIIMDVSFPEVCKRFRSIPIDEILKIIERIPEIDETAKEKVKQRIGSEKNYGNEGRA